MSKSKHKTNKPLALRWWYLALEAVFVLGMFDSLGKDGTAFLTFLIIVAFMGFFTFRALKARKKKADLSSFRTVKASCNYYSLSLDEAFSSSDYIAFDTETTGLDPYYDRIIEVAAIKFKDDQMVDSFRTLLCPEALLDPRISEITGITDKDLENKPRFENIADGLINFIGDLPLLAHNADFDARFLSSELKRCGRSFNFKYIDTLKLSRSTFPKIKVHKLNYLVKAFHITDMEQTHRAFDDALLCQKIFMHCKNHRNNL